MSRHPGYITMKELLEYESMPNCMVMELDDFAENPEYFNDNRKDLFELFEIIFDSERFATGWQWRCKKCGSIAFSQEVLFECKRCFVSIVVKCIHGCHTSWNLKINTCPSIKNADGEKVAVVTTH